jgi:hypothetical protein
MNWTVTFYTALLFFILTPAILVRLPPKGNKYTVAAFHALVFALVFHFTGKIVWQISSGMEGFSEGLKYDMNNLTQTEKTAGCDKYPNADELYTGNSAETPLSGAGKQQCITSDITKGTNAKYCNDLGMVYKSKVGNHTCTPKNTLPTSLTPQQITAYKQAAAALLANPSTPLTDAQLTALRAGARTP